MNKPRNWVRVLVLVAVAAWPAYEYNRYRGARQALAASVELRQSMEAKLSAAKVKYAAADSAPTQVR